MSFLAPIVSASVKYANKESLNYSETHYYTVKYCYSVTWKVKFIILLEGIYLDVIYFKNELKKLY